MSFEVALLTAGVILLLVGLVGHIKVKEFEIGSYNLFIRFVTAIIGGLLVLASFNPSFLNCTSEPSIIKPNHTVKEVEGETIIKNTVLPEPLPLVPGGPENGAIGPRMIRVGPGDYFRGANLANGSMYEDDEQPYRRVSVPAFEISVYEITWREWEACENAQKCEELQRPTNDMVNKEELLTHPVVNVSIEQIRQYISWLEEELMGDFRLPSEAEWEYAARADTTTLYSWGNDVGVDNANCKGCLQNGPEVTTPVTEFQPNQFGIYNMHGNVWEWVADCYQDRYDDAPTDGSVYKNGCNETDAHVIRGGAWDNEPRHLRSSNRESQKFDTGSDNVGFRLARTIP